jgi:hyperosmotically inducible periplasmic protein
MATIMKSRILILGLLASALSLGAAAQSSAARYDNDIQAKATQQLQDKKEFRNVQAVTEDGIVTLTGNVELFQQKLDAAKKVRKVNQVQGVRNLIEVSSVASDEQIADKLQRKVNYDRVGFDARFNYVAVSVNDGVATLSGLTRTDIARNDAANLATRMPGVKDVINNITVAPPSPYDDDIRIRAARAIYRDPMLSRYALDPVGPIRIVVDRGQLCLYGTVATQTEKQVAGIRAGQVFGAFNVQNNLVVEKGS